MVTLTQGYPVWTLDLGNDENVFSPTWLDEIEAALDQLDDATGPCALLTTGSGKFFSNGLDLPWLLEHLDQATSYVVRVQAIYARILTLAVPTVAAINGHAFGAGAMLALAHDYRVMRADRGFFCLPEVDLRVPFAPGMNALVTGKLSPATARDTMLTGRRFGGPEALAAGIIDAVADEASLQTRAADLVRDLAAKDLDTVATIKSRMYADIVEALHRHEI